MVGNYQSMTGATHSVIRFLLPAMILPSFPQPFHPLPPLPMSFYSLTVALLVDNFVTAASGLKKKMASLCQAVQHSPDAVSNQKL